MDWGQNGPFAMIEGVIVDMSAARGREGREGAARPPPAFYQPCIKKQAPGDRMPEKSCF